MAQFSTAPVDEVLPERKPKKSAKTAYGGHPRAAKIYARPVVKDYGHLLSTTALARLTGSSTDLILSLRREMGIPSPTTTPLLPIGLSFYDAARELEVNVQSVNEWVQAGSLPCTVDGRIEENILDAFRHSHAELICEAKEAMLQKAPPTVNPAQRAAWDRLWEALLKVPEEAESEC